MKLTMPTRGSTVYNITPLTPLLSLSRELDRLFGAGAEERSSAQPSFAPCLDVIEDKDGFIVRLDLPGVPREQVRVALQEDVLTIAGERKPETLEKEAGYHRQERISGRFERSIALPKPVDASKVTAAFKDGVLQVSLPKSAEAKPRQIDISGN